MYIYVLCNCLAYREAVILSKVTVYTDFILCISFTLRRKVFKVLISKILICRLVLNIFICVLETFSYDKL